MKPIKREILRFHPSLVPLVLDGSKYKTWRLWDNKDLKAGDRIYFSNSQTNEIFALAELTNTNVKKMSEINEVDKTGHENVGSCDQMLKTYANYYNKEVTGNTEVKVIEFKILKTFQ